MQGKYSDLQLITPQNIHSTVMCDERTCLWFKKLFSLPTVIGRVTDSNEGRQLYANYRTFTTLATVSLILSLILFLMGLLYSKKLYLLFVLSTATTSGISVLGMLRARHHLAQLAAHLIVLDHNILTPGLTLYQLGEIYSRQYKSPSLVALIWVYDQWLRNAYLLLFASAFGVFFLPFWKMILWLLAGYFLATCFIKAWIMSQKEI